MNINTLIRFGLPLFLLLCFSPLCAQPVLQEWWRAPNTMSVGQAITYLPNFYQGKGAMAIIYNGKAVTWLNQYAGDTNNIFSWKGGLPIRMGDFNGDGIQDYVDADGYVYQGQGNGQLPLQEPVANIVTITRTIVEVMDVNHDGLADVVVAINANDSLGISVAYGNRDLRSMKLQRSKESIRYSTKDEIEDIKAMYRAQDSSLMLVIYRTRRFMNTPIDNFLLYRAFWAKDSSEPVFEMVDEIRGNDTKRLYSGLAYFRFDPKTKKSYLFIHSIVYSSFLVYDVSNGRLNAIGRIGYLPQFLNTPTQKGFGWLGTNRYYTRLYAGDFSPETLPYVERRYDTIADNNLVGHTEASIIDDVNGDGIADIALGYSSGNISNFFRIVLGVSPTTSIQAAETSSFTLSDPAPHPISDNSRLKIQIQNPGNYTLFIQDSRGQVYAPLFEGNLQAGEQIIPLQINGFSAGAYILVLQDAGKKVIGSRTIIIE
jgi:hypothetical protein